MIQTSRDGFQNCTKGKTQKKKFRIKFSAAIQKSSVSDPICAKGCAPLPRGAQSIEGTRAGASAHAPPSSDSSSKTEMADSEFEELRHVFNRSNAQQNKTTSPFYSWVNGGGAPGPSLGLQFHRAVSWTRSHLFHSLVPNVDIEEVSPTSSQSGSSCAGDVRPIQTGPALLDPHTRASSGEDDEDDDGLRIGRINGHAAPGMGNWNGNGERRRRKLPEIPKNKKCKTPMWPLH